MFKYSLLYLIGLYMGHGVNIHQIYRERKVIIQITHAILLNGENADTAKF